MHPLAAIALMLCAAGGIIAFLRDELHAGSWGKYPIGIGLFVSVVGALLDISGVWPG